MLYIISALIAALCYFIPLASSSPVTFILQLVRVNDSSAVYQWAGLPKQTQITSCWLYSQEDGLTEIETQPVFNPEGGQQFGLLLNLKPSTVYKVHISCQTGRLYFESTHVNFTTASSGESYTIPQPSTTSEYSQPITTADPEVTKTRLVQKETPVTDIAVGVFFGIVGLVVVVVMLYYVVLKVRRHQRITRFLQYRQQENDPFPEFADPEQELEE